MKTLIIFDSEFGNTALIAHAIAHEIGADATALVADQAKSVALDDVDLLIIGSPTQGGRATPVIQKIIDSLPKLNGLKVSAFDTRFSKTDHGLGLRVLMTAIGFAASKIADDLRAKGGELVGEPAGFLVENKQGPLLPGELARAAAWASNLIHQPQLF